MQTIVAYIVTSVAKLDVCGIGETLYKKERIMEEMLKTEGVMRVSGSCHRGTRGGGLITAASWLLAALSKTNPVRKLHQFPIGSAPVVIDLSE